MVLIGVAVFGLWPFCFEGFNLKSSVFLASAWCLGFQAFRILGFLGSLVVWGSGALFYTGGSGGFLGFLGFGGSGALFYTGGFRWFARRPLAQRRKSPKGDTSGGGHPRRETRPEAKLPEGRHARRRTIQKWILTLWQWFLTQRRALAPGRERCA